MKRITILCFFLLSGVSCVFTACGSKPAGLYGTPYSREELEKMNVNTEHLFIFDLNKMTYNGKEFYPGMTIEEFVEIFGKYSRKIKGQYLLGDYTSYIWDDWGFFVDTYPRKDTPLEIVGMIEIRWNLDMSGDSHPTNDPDLLKLRKAMIDGNPKTYFKGNILVGGAPLGRGMDYRTDFNGKSNIIFGRRKGDLIASHQIHQEDYDYSKIKYHKEDHVFSYLIRLSEDYENIENFNVPYDYYFY